MFFMEIGGSDTNCRHNKHCSMSLFSLMLYLPLFSIFFCFTGSRNGVVRACIWSLLVLKLCRVDLLNAMVMQTRKPRDRKILGDGFQACVFILLMFCFLHCQFTTLMKNSRLAWRLLSIEATIYSAKKSSSNVSFNCDTTSFDLGGGEKFSACKVKKMCPSI